MQHSADHHSVKEIFDSEAKFRESVRQMVAALRHPKVYGKLTRKQQAILSALLLQPAENLLATNPLGSAATNGNDMDLDASIAALNERFKSNEFKKMFSYLTALTKSFSELQKFILSLEKKNPKAHKSITSAFEKLELHSIDNYISMPMQRGPRYLLLLNEANKNTANKFATITPHMEENITTLNEKANNNIFTVMLDNLSQRVKHVGDLTKVDKLQQLQQKLLGIKEAINSPNIDSAEKLRQLALLKTLLKEIRADKNLYILLARDNIRQFITEVNLLTEARRDMRDEIKGSYQKTLETFYNDLLSKCNRFAAPSHFNASTKPALIAAQNYIKQLKEVNLQYMSVEQKISALNHMLMQFDSDPNLKLAAKILDKELKAASHGVKKLISKLEIDPQKELGKLNASLQEKLMPKTVVVTNKQSAWTNAKPSANLTNVKK